MSTGGRHHAHFAVEQWADFVRGLTREEERTVMQNHLATGCAKCSDALGFAERVYRTAQRESAYQPPDGAVRIVKAAFRVAQTRPLGVVAAQVLFDSSLDPLPSGVRSTAPTSRQLLFGAGQYRIDVRIEPQVDRDQVTLVGQLLTAAGEGKGVESARVKLVKGRKVVAETSTSEFGEFHLDCELEGVELHVLVQPEEEIVVRLVEPNAEAIGEMGSQAAPETAKRPRRSTRTKV
jgi:hypothetical protein